MKSEEYRASLKGSSIRQSKHTARLSSDYLKGSMDIVGSTKQTLPLLLSNYV